MRPYYVRGNTESELIGELDIIKYQRHDQRYNRKNTALRGCVPDVQDRGEKGAPDSCFFRVVEHIIAC